jgi:hypothetical protein
MAVRPANLRNASAELLSSSEVVQPMLKNPSSRQAFQVRSQNTAPPKETVRVIIPTKSAGLENLPIDMNHESKVVKLKSETQGPRPALPAISQNIACAKETAPAVPSIVASISKAILPDPFFAFLTKKIEVCDLLIFC